MARLCMRISDKFMRDLPLTALIPPSCCHNFAYTPQISNLYDCTVPGVAVLTVRELFEFVVDPVITEDTLDAALDRLMEIATRYYDSLCIGSPSGKSRKGIFTAPLPANKCPLWNYCKKGALTVGAYSLHQLVEILRCLCLLLVLNEVSDSCQKIC